uniref:WAP domain-containing protein n=1 Tax=Biomphalaria glabrata TaxID=6526 RepID=A0A2C9L2N3_BIOGL
MLLKIVLFTHIFFLSSGQEVSRNGSCVTSPLPCVHFNVVEIHHECGQDSDCPAAVKCCYIGCVRTCQSFDPCEKVTCTPGYTCLARETPCEKRPCILEASCVSETQVRCPALRCPTEFCPAGQERVVDPTGCPTCECKRKKVCPQSCSLFCAYGLLTTEDGCPVCKCRAEPGNPCTNKVCPVGEECRLVTPQSCNTSICKPEAKCVSKLRSMFDNSCALKDKTTLGYPVLEEDGAKEIDCYRKRCLDGTVCTKFGNVTYRCCLQFSQEQIWMILKPGQCPQEYMISADDQFQPCEVDGQCPSDQKCCYRTKNQFALRSSGACMTPVHSILSNKTTICTGTTILSSVLRTIGAC